MTQSEGIVIAGVGQSVLDWSGASLGDAGPHRGQLGLRLVTHTR